MANDAVVRDFSGDGPAELSGADDVDTVAFGHTRKCSIESMRGEAGIPYPQFLKSIVRYQECMNKGFFKLTCTIAFLVVSTGLPAFTFLVDTRDSMPLEDMGIDRRIHVVSAESGIMDTLFDEGHIFFNIYSVPDDEGNFPSWESTVTHAKDVGANYLLKLTPDENGLSWEFYIVRDVRMLDEGYAEISTVSSDLKPVDRWTALGESVAEEMMESIR
jgi:hypothetical protein